MTPLFCVSTMLTPLQTNRLRLSVFALALAMGFSACARMPHVVKWQDINGLGRFEFRGPETAMTGVVIGAPHGDSAPRSTKLASAVSEKTGAGFVAAYGFKSSRITVARPLVRDRAFRTAARDQAKRGSMYREYKQLVGEVAGGEIDFYIDFRSRPLSDKVDRLQAVTSGFTFEELKIIKQSYLQIRERLIGGEGVKRLTLLMSPLETITWEASAMRHHGLLLVAERGLSLRIPEKHFSGAAMSLYVDIFSTWITEIVRLIQENPRGLQQAHTKLMDLGRLDLFGGDGVVKGVVIGSPHGSYDHYTAELVQQISYDTGLPAVISTGFTPTEAGGWRINVNRPTEKSWAPEFEIDSERSQEVYRTYRNLVMKAARGELALYFDIHQYGGRRIQVATVGIALEEAREIKKTYLAIRDRLLADQPDVDIVELLIEPLDDIEIVAWAAKHRGILGVAKRSFHFELPLYSFFRTDKSRALYGKILTELLKQIATDANSGVPGHSEY
jgi:hypothetical protein